MCVPVCVEHELCVYVNVGKGRETARVNDRRGAGGVRERARERVGKRQGVVRETETEKKT